MAKELRAQRAAESTLILGRQRFLELSGLMCDTYGKLDGTLSHTLRLTAEMIDTAHDIGLEPEKGQKLFSSLSQCTNKMIETRDNLIAAHLEATKIRMKTDQAETGDGCLPGPGGKSRPTTLRVAA